MTDLKNLLSTLVWVKQTLLHNEEQHMACRLHVGLQSSICSLREFLNTSTYAQP